jgi:hypothetical protein
MAKPSAIGKYPTENFGMQVAAETQISTGGYNAYPDPFEMGRSSTRSRPTRDPRKSALIGVTDSERSMHFQFALATSSETI